MNTKLIESIRNVLVSGAYLKARYDGHIGGEIQQLGVVHFVGGWQVSFKIRGSLYLFTLEDCHVLTEDEQERLLGTTNLQLIKVLSGQEPPPFDNKTDLATYAVLLASFPQAEVVDQVRPIYEDGPEEPSDLETFDGEALP